MDIIILIVLLSAISSLLFFPYFTPDIIRFRNNKRKYIDLRIVKSTYPNDMEKYQVEQKFYLVFGSKWQKLSIPHNSFDEAMNYLKKTEEDFYNSKKHSEEVVYYNKYKNSL